MRVNSQLEKAQLENLTADPSAGTKGRVWHNTTSGLPKFDDGTGVRTFYHTNNTVAVANGGTNITSYTTGDVLYATGATTLAKLGIGTAGQVLKTNAGATAPEWATPTTASFAYSSKTHADTGYTITANDDFILWTLTNGSNDTATLPAASGNTGKVLKIKLAASTAGFNTLTVSRAGSDTITHADGTTSLTSLVFQTAGETIELISDGTSVWQVLNHRCNTAWVSYTPTMSGFGTVSNVASYWRRVGDSVEVSVFFKAGTVSSSTATISNPGGLSIDTAKTQGSQQGILGHYSTSTNAGGDGVWDVNIGGLVYYNSGTGATVVALAEKSAATGTNLVGTANGNDLLDSNNTLNARFTIPISGWYP